MLSTEEQAAAEAARQMRIQEIKLLEENNRQEELKLALKLEQKQKEVEEILRKKKEEEDRKRREAEELRQREESIKLKRAAEEKRKRDEEDRRMQMEREEAQKRRAELKEKEAEARQLGDGLSAAKDKTDKEKEEGVVEVACESVNNTDVTPSIQQIKKTEKIHMVTNEIRLQAESSISERRTPIGLKCVPKVPGKLSENSGGDMRAISPKCTTQETSELVRVQNRMLQRNRLADLEMADIFQERNATAHSQEKFSSMSGRWKDVKIGLVKDRASSYLRPDENHNYGGGGYQQSPRMKRKILNPASWFRATTPTASQQQVECVQNAVNLQKHGVKLSTGDGGAVKEKLLNINDVEEKENNVVLSADFCRVEEKNVKLCKSVNEAEISVKQVELSCTQKVTNITKDTGSADTSSAPVDISSTLETKHKTADLSKAGIEGNLCVGEASCQKSQPQELLAGRPKNGWAETAPWRKLDGGRSRTDLSSPSLNLMSVSVTPSSSAKDVIQAAAGTQAASEAKPARPQVLDPGKSVVELDLRPLDSPEARDKRAAVEKLEETMKELQQHVELLGK
jgi:hypothetical protein